jgi:hypothetical protein
VQETTVLNLFKEFTNGTVDLFGLKCIPAVINSIHESGESTYQIGFEIENPSNVSYFGPIVHEELFELVNSFGEYINIKVKYTKFLIQSENSNSQQELRLLDTNDGLSK